MIMQYYAMTWWFMELQALTLLLTLRVRAHARFSGRHWSSDLSWDRFRALALLGISWHLQSDDFPKRKMGHWEVIEMLKDVGSIEISKPTRAIRPWSYANEYSL